MFSTRDYIKNVDGRDFREAQDKVLQTPDVNTSGRLPTVLLVHLKMQARITVSDERLTANASVDATGIVQNIEVDSIDGSPQSRAIDFEFRQPLTWEIPQFGRLQSGS